MSAEQTFVRLMIDWLDGCVEDDARKEGGRYWAEYGRAHKAVACIFAIGAAALIVAVLFAKPQKWPLMAGLSLLVFGLPSAILLLEFFVVRIGFDEERIECRSPWRLRRTIPWTSVQSCSYSDFAKWWVVDAGVHGKIRLSNWLSGQKALLAMMKSRTGISARVSEG